MKKLWILIGILALAVSAPAGTVSGDLKAWHTVTVSFTGPSSSESATSPNPFFNYRLQVTFTGPSSQSYVVPGFFDGDGNGGASGSVWRVRFSPDEGGTWTYSVSMRQGTDSQGIPIALSLETNGGTAWSPLNGDSGNFSVSGLDTGAPGLLSKGRLEYIAGQGIASHYLKFRDGGYWLKGGTDSPENFLGYNGFDNTPNAHQTYTAHATHWVTGDPDWNRADPAGTNNGKNIIGSLNYLSSKGVNSIYAMTMNIGGDGRDCYPYLAGINLAGSSSNDNSHIDISKVRQWEIVFEHAQKKGIVLHLVLNESEQGNKLELDNATLGNERKLYYRELIARFGHHPGVIWNLCEEYDVLLPIHPDMIKSWAGYIQSVDPYDHPITVHQALALPNSWIPFLGDSRFSITSFQTANDTMPRADLQAITEDFRTRSTNAGRPIPISLDEFNKASKTDDDNIASVWPWMSGHTRLRKDAIWPIYLSGGMAEYILYDGVGTAINFASYEPLWNYLRYARTFMENNLPFWQMSFNDSLLSGENLDRGPGQVFYKTNEVYAIYLPKASATGTLNMSGTSGTFDKRWFNPRTGNFEGATTQVTGGGNVALGTPPSATTEDWVCLIKKPSGGGADDSYVHLTVDNSYDQVYLNGTLQSNGANRTTWSAYDSFGPIANLTTVAVKLVNNEPGTDWAGFLAKVEGAENLVSDTTWKAYYGTPAADGSGKQWYQVGYNDSSWIAPTSQGTYGCTPWNSPTGLNPEFTGSGAQWIWHGNPRYGVSPIYLRKTISQPDTTDPTTPTNLQVTGTTTSTISLSWTASSDNVGVTGYDVYENGAYLDSTSGTSYTASGLSAGTTYSYRVLAYDTAGNESALSSPVTGTTQSGGGGANLFANTNVNYDFEDEDPAGEVRGWQDRGATMWRDTTTRHGGAGALTLQGPWGSGSYTFCQDFNDAAEANALGMSGGQAHTFSAWVKLQGSGASAWVVIGATSLIPQSETNHLSGTQDWTLASYNFTSQSGPATSAMIQLRYILAAGEQVWFDDLSITGPGGGDTQAPSVPSGLTVGAVTSSTVALSWNASTDNVGVTGYKIFRNGSQCGTSATTAFTDTGLSASTTYSYKVSAYDAVPNESAQSSQVTATTQSGGGTNLLLNPGLDDDTSPADNYPDNWWVRAEGTRDTSTKRSGTASLRVSPADRYSQQSCNLTPSASYTLSGWAKTSSVSGSGLRMQYAQLTPSGAGFNSNFITGTSDWALMTVAFTAPSDHLTGRVDLRWIFTAGTAWFDDLSLVQN